MSAIKQSLPPVASRGEWEAALSDLLVKEKELTRARDALNAERRKLPMVKMDKPYAFQGDEGSVSFLDLFAGRRQLIVYHFMFAPDWAAGCDGCSWVADAMTHPAHLHARDTSLVMVSRAPLEKTSALQSTYGLDDSLVLVFRKRFQRRRRRNDGGGRKAWRERIPARR